MEKNRMELSLGLLLVLLTSSFCYKCGKEGGYHTRMSGGSYTSPNQYPWMVQFKYYVPDSPNPHYCSGSLITDRLVLTAKHCTDPEKRDRWGTAKVGVHNNNVYNEDFLTAEEVHFEKVIWHETDERNDIAILLLKEPVDLDDPKIGLVCLPETDKEDYVGEKVRSMGWGMEKFDEKKKKAVWGDELKHVDLEVAKKQDKYFIYTELKKIGGIYQDPCAGDSGGPLLHKEKGKWVIIGTVNGQGYDCRTGKVNPLSPLGSWNKVTSHLDWIKSQINKYNPGLIGKKGNDYELGGQTSKELDDDSNTFQMDQNGKTYLINVGNKTYLVQEEA